MKNIQHRDYPLYTAYQRMSTKQLSTDPESLREKRFPDEESFKAVFTTYHTKHKELCKQIDDIRDTFDQLKTERDNITECLITLQQVFLEQHPECTPDCFNDDDLDNDSYSEFSETPDLEPPKKSAEPAPKKKAKPTTEPEAEAAPKKKGKTAAKPEEVEAEPEAEPVPKKKGKTAAKPEEAEPEAEAAPKKKGKTAAKPEPEVEVEPEAEAAPKKKGKAAAKPEPEVEAEPVPKKKGKAAAKPEPEVEAEPEAEPKKKGKAAAKPEPEAEAVPKKKGKAAKP